MLLRRKGLPEEGELLLCEVKKVHFHSVFVRILEYGMEGMIHISEIAPGRIRNIRDYVREGKFIVCKALRVNRDKGQVDLSLRRVNERERKEKTNQITLEKRAEKIVEHVAKLTGIETTALYRELTSQLFKDYDFLYDAFLDVTQGGLELAKLGLKPNLAKTLKEAIEEKIKPPQATIKGNLRLASFAANGVEAIRQAIKQARLKTEGNFEIKYLGGGAYSLKVTGANYAECGEVLKSLLSNLEASLSKSNGSVSFEKD